MGLLSALYGLGLKCKKFYCRNPDTLPAKVISVGNLTLGGTGKTPTVISIAQEAKNRGFSPCIVTRGYRGKTGETCFVSKGDTPLLHAQEAGDEAYLMAQALKGIPVVKGKKRYEACMFFLEASTSEIRNQESEIVFILDDGFQHWKLYRDIDVLLIDATNPFGNEKLFPEGTLREPMKSINRAHMIVITKADMANKKKIAAVTQKIRQHNPEAPIYTASHNPVSLTAISGEMKDLDTLTGRKICAFAGIADPGSFQSTLTALGADIVSFRKFRDHYVYRQKDLDKIRKHAVGLDIVTTEKDLVKLTALNLPENLYALKIQFSIDNEFYNRLFTILDH